ncbi:MAG: glycosyltransferase [Acidimicrobiia bacterium]
MLRTPMNRMTPLRVGIVSTFPPTQCGIGRFARSLVDSLNEADSSLEIRIVRLNTEHSPHVARSDVVMDIDPENPIGIRAAARHLRGYDLCLIQHEFGIFGGDDGSSIIDLVESLDLPIVVVLHTVLANPSPRQKTIMETLAANASLVVTCNSAAQILRERYAIQGAPIRVIPHGAQWTAQPPNHQPRRQLITWGLLGPGKGLERSIEAVSHVRDLDPPISYRIVGRTHPAVASRHGYGYRHMLQEMVADLGVGDLVDFIDRYVSDQELCDLVRQSDLVVVPYDNHDQVSSGVITEALGLGRPVVSTRFPYSEELLASGAGMVVNHGADALARAVRRLLDDPIAYREAAREAARLSSELSWPNIALQYSRLIHRLAPAYATA